MTPAERAWYYADVNAEIGPLTIQQLKRRIASTPGFEETFVWSEGMAEWKKAGEIPELLAATQVSPRPQNSRTKYIQITGTRNRRLLKISIVAILAASWSALIFLLTLSDPSTNDLDRDISSIKAEIASAAGESEKYSGGLLKGLIETRGEMLRVTEAMLNAKRTSILRRVDLRFNIEGRRLTPSSASDLAKVESDISEARRRVASAEERAGQYTGGMIQALALTTVETERLALAQLHMAFYSAKYGMAAPRSAASESGEAPTKPVPGTVVKDKDAL